MFVSDSQPWNLTMPTTLTITFSPEDRKFVEPVAKAKGMKLGPFVRQAALDAAVEAPLDATDDAIVFTPADRNNHRDRRAPYPGEYVDPQPVSVDTAADEARGMTLNDPPESGWTLPDAETLADLIRVPVETAEKVLKNNRVSRDEEGHLRVNGVLVEEEA